MAGHEHTEHNHTQRTRAWRTRHKYKHNTQRLDQLSLLGDSAATGAACKPLARSSIPINFCFDEAAAFALAPGVFFAAADARPP